jgi:hypothetical protein
MRARTLLIAGLLVVLSLVLAIWIAVAERPNAAAARDAETAQRLEDPAMLPPASAERVEVPPHAAPAEPSATSPATAAPPKPEAPAQRSVWLAVVDHDGAPVIGATVMVSERMDPGPEHRKLVGATDVGGRVELPLDSPKEMYVRAFTLDHASSGWARLSKLALDAQQARVLPVVRMAHVVGLVAREDGTPVRRARVDLDVLGQLFGQPFAEHPPQLATDDKGRFESYIEAFGGSFRATASVGEQVGQPHEFHPELGQEIEFTLHVGDELSVSGVVTAPDRSAVANASVVVRSDPGAIDDSHPIAQEVKCDVHGHFRYPLPHTGRFEACASSEAWASSNNMAFEVTAEKPSAELGLVLVQGVTIEGRVVRDDGAPLADVDVFAHHDTCSNCSRADRAASGTLRGLRARTNTDGHFVLEPARVDPHLYTVVCAPDPKRPKAWLEVRDVAAGTHNVEIVVSEAALIGAVFEGRVVLEDTGEPLTAMQFQISRWHGTYWDHIRDETIQSADGHFRIEALQLGTDYAAFIYNIAGYMPVIVERWTATRESKPVELVMLKPRVLDVTVTDERGTPSASALVKFNVEHRHPGYEGFLVNQTDRDGFARMNFWPGAFSISASLGERHSETLPIVIADRNAPLTLVVPSK